MKINKVLFFIIVLGFLLRLGSAIYFMSTGDAEPWEPEEIAKNLAGGRGFTNRYLNATYYSHEMPMYPFVCAGLYKLFGVNHRVVIFLQIIVSLFTCVVIFDLGRRVGNSMIGIVSSLACAIHPGLIVYSTAKLHPLTFDAFFITLTLWAFMYLGEVFNFRRSLLTGFITGLCILSRSTVIAFIPIGVIWLFWKFRKDSSKRFLINASAILITMLLTISPWVIRNLFVHKTFVLTSTADMEVFWRGNNINATGTSYTLSGKTVLSQDNILYNKLVSTDEIGQRRLFREEALKFIKGNPRKFIELFFKKLYYFWWFSPSSGIFYPRAYMRFYKYLYSVFAFLAFIGCYGIFIRKVAVDYANFALLLIFLLSFSLFQSLFYIEGRHRWAIEPVFLIVSAIGLTVLFKNINLQKEENNENYR